MSQVIGHGSAFEVESVVPGTFTTIAGVTEVDLGSNKVDAIENTDMSTAGNKRTYQGGLEDPGDITVKINVKPGDASQTYVFTCKDATVRNFKIVYPGAVRTLAFAGIILSIDETITDQKLPTFGVKVKISGAVTIT
jgi:hypothetical protein